MNVDSKTLIFCLTLVSLSSAVSAAGPSINSTYTTSPPTIDGALGEGEWSNGMNVTLNGFTTSTNTMTGTLYIMHNASHLFVALVLDDSSEDAGSDWIVFDFDQGADHAWTINGEDAVDFGWTGTGYSDDCWYNMSALIPGEIWWYADSWASGAQHGNGSSSHSGSQYTYEIAKPLNSTESTDMAVALGDVIGFRIEFWENTAGDNYRYPQDTIDVNESGWAAWADLTVVSTTTTSTSTTTSSTTSTTSTSTTSTLSANNPPSCTVNSPTNNSNHTQGSVTLNVTCNDADGDNMTVKIFGRNGSSEDMSAHLLHYEENLSNGSTFADFWMSVIIENDATAKWLYHLDQQTEYGETDSLVFDFSGNGNNGTISGSTATINKSGGYFGGGLVFDGSASNNLTINTSVVDSLETGTLSMWFKFVQAPNEDGELFMPLLFYGPADTTNGSGLIVEVGHSVPSWHGGHENATEIFFTISNGSMSPNFCFDSLANLTNNTWYNYVVTVNETGNTGYLNGVEMTDRRYNFGTENDSVFFSYLNGFGSKVFTVGAGKGALDNTWYQFNGTVDEVAIWNRSLTAQEVQNLYQLQVGTWYWMVSVTDGTDEVNYTNQFTLTEPPIAVNASVNATANTTTDVSGGATNVSLQFETTASITDAIIAFSQVSSNPTGANFGATSLGKYYNVTPSAALEGNLSWVVITINYTAAELAAANINESLLWIYWFNSSASDWVALNESGKSGRNTTVDPRFVWANTTHFSTFTIGAASSSTTEDIVMALGWNLISLPVTI